MTGARQGIRSVHAARGRIVTHADLPCVKTRRWLPAHKEAIVLGVACGLLTRDEMCRRYGLAPEELEAWEAAVESDGVDGLRIAHRRATRASRAKAAA